MTYPETITKSPLKSTSEIYLQKVLNEIIFGPLTIQKIIPGLTEYYFENDLYKILVNNNERNNWQIMKISNSFVKDTIINKDDIVGIPITIDLFIRALKIKYKHLINDDSIIISSDNSSNVTLRFMKHTITFLHFDDSTLCLSGCINNICILFDIPKTSLFKSI